MLRLRNVDPTDPEVWWALVSRRATEHAPVDVPAPTDPSAELGRIPTADEFVDQARQQHRRALTRLGPEQADHVLDRLRSEFLAVTEEVRSVAAAALGDGRADAARRGAERSSGSGETLSTFRWRLGSAWDETESTPTGTLEQLLAHAGSIHVEAALAERRRHDAESGVERTLPPKLYVLELTRALLLVSLIATAAAAVWLVRLSMGASLLPDNETLSPAGIARIGSARPRSARRSPSSSPRRRSGRIRSPCTRAGVVPHRVRPDRRSCASW